MRLWCITALTVLALALGGTARANYDDGALAAPRAAVEIQGVGVVLIATNGKLHAFVDRVADNAPLDDAGLFIVLAESRPLSLTRVSPGLFIAPYDPGARRKDHFLISIGGPDGVGDAMAEIGFASTRELPGQGAADDPSTRLQLMVASGVMGLIIGTLGMRWWLLDRAQARTI